MSFKIRNSLVLGAVFALITAGLAFYFFYLQPRQLESSTKNILEIEAQLKELPVLMNTVEELTIQHQDIKRKYDSRSKEIPRSDITSQTYAYMSRGIDEAGYLRFNMRFKGEKKGSGWGYNVYELYGGEAGFREFYRFIYFIENGRRLYKIATLDLKQEEAIDSESKDIKKWMAFSMEIHAYFTDIDVLGVSIAARPLPVVNPPFDPFNPLIAQVLIMEAPAGEIDIRVLDIKAVLPGKAFALWGNELIVLHVGDNVWRGSVTRIDPTQSLVEFMINEGGIVRVIRKNIVFESKK
jgi:hypothetical protein